MSNELDQARQTMSEPRTTNTYVRDCPNCGPGTYRVKEGVPRGCLCDFEPETLVIRCGGSEPRSES